MLENTNEQHLRAQVTAQFLLTCALFQTHPNQPAVLRKFVAMMSEKIASTEDPEMGAHLQEFEQLIHSMLQVD